jgi:hypothetical protein
MWSVFIAFTHQRSPDRLALFWLVLLGVTGIPRSNIMKLRHTAPLVLMLGNFLLGLSAFAAAPTDKGDHAEVYSLTMEVNKYWNGAEAESLKMLSKGHPVILSWEMMHLEKTMGVAAEGIERAAMLVQDGDLVFIVRTVKPVNQRTVIDRLIPKPTETRTEKGHCWTSDKTSQVVCLSDGRTLVIAPAAWQLSSTEILPWSAGKLATLGDATTDKTLLVFHFSPAMVRGLVKPDDKRSEPFQPLIEAKSLRLKMEVDHGLRVTFNTVFPDQATAERALPAIKKVVEGLNSYFDMAKTKMPEFLKTQQQQYPGSKEVADRLTRAIDATQTALAHAKIARNANEVEATILVKTEQPASTAVLMLSLVPRPKKK